MKSSLQEQKVLAGVETWDRPQVTEARKSAGAHVKVAVKSLVAAMGAFHRADKGERAKMGGMDTFRALTRLSNDVAKVGQKMGLTFESTELPSPLEEVDE